MASGTSGEKSMGDSVLDCDYGLKGLRTIVMSATHKERGILMVNVSLGAGARELSGSSRNRFRPIKGTYNMFRQIYFSGIRSFAMWRMCGNVRRRWWRLL